MRIYKDLPDAVGNTPLIRLKKASEITGCEILGKAEFLNPGQSVKDRAALWITRWPGARCAPAAPSSRAPPATPASAWRRRQRARVRDRHRHARQPECGQDRYA